MVLLVCGLVVLATAIRLVGIRWDRPFFLHPDESTVTDPATGLLHTGRLRPRLIRGEPKYVYPPLLAEVLALECLAYYPFSSWPSLAEIPKASVRMAGRVTSACAAVLTVVLLALWARQLTNSVGTAALAGATLALSPLHAESSRYATTDVMTGMWVLLAAWAAMRIVDQGRWRHYVLGAVAVGVAAATKYPAGIACVLVGAAHLARPEILSSRREHAKLVVAALVTIATMLAVLPPGLVNWSEVLDGIRFAAHVYGRGHKGFQSPHPALDALRTLGSVGLGEGAMAATLLLWVRGPTSRRRLVPLIVLILGYLVLLGWQSMFLARNLLHFVPTMILLAAWGICRGLEWARSRGPLMVAALSIAFVLPSAVRAAAQVRALGARDTRLLARDWLSGRLKPGTKVVLANGEHAYSMVPLDGLNLQVRRADRPNLDALYRAGFRWIVYSDSSDMRYLRSPQRFPQEVERIRRWFEKLRPRASLEKSFPRRLMPGWDLPGSTANMYHQPGLRIFRLQAPPPQSAQAAVP